MNPAAQPLGQNPFCFHAKCQSPSTLQAGFKFRIKRLRDKASGDVDIMTRITTCEAHQNLLTRETLLTPAARAAVAQSFKGQAVIDFMKAEIVFKPFKGE